MGGPDGRRAVQSVNILISAGPDDRRCVNGTNILGGNGSMSMTSNRDGSKGMASKCHDQVPQIALPALHAALPANLQVTFLRWFRRANRHRGLTTIPACLPPGSMRQADPSMRQIYSDPATLLFMFLCCTGVDAYSPACEAHLPTGSDRCLFTACKQSCSELLFSKSKADAPCKSKTSLLLRESAAGLQILSFQLSASADTHFGSPAAVAWMSAGRRHCRRSTGRCKHPNWRDFLQAVGRRAPGSPSQATHVGPERR